MWSSEFAKTPGVRELLSGEAARDNFLAFVEDFLIRHF